MKRMLLAAAAGIALLSGSASAAPLGLTKDVGAALSAETSVTPVHFSHGTCQLGRAGWHYHNRYGNRIVCRPFVRRYNRY